MYIYCIYYTELAPPSKKSLNFSETINNATNGGTMDSVNTSTTTEQAQSRKRDCDEMFLPLSSDEDEDVSGQKKPSSPAPGL